MSTFEDRGEGRDDRLLGDAGDVLLAVALGQDRVTRAQQVAIVSTWGARLEDDAKQRAAVEHAHAGGQRDDRDVVQVSPSACSGRLGARRSRACASRRSAPRGRSATRREELVREPSHPGRRPARRARARSRWQEAARPHIRSSRTREELPGRADDHHLTAALAMRDRLVSHRDRGEHAQLRHAALRGRGRRRG